ncbi:MAG: hypothetical protein ACLR4A_02570 [Christensenellales bacterium]|jgi:hypothetical protein|nr:MAG TPA: putative GntR-family transcriptional regulator [Caudoviricetes sp.]
MNNPMSMLLNMAMQNSNIANNPRAQEMLQVIQSGDAQKGQQIAMNLCKTYGVSKEQAVGMATEYFKNQLHIPL